MNPLSLFFDKFKINIFLVLLGIMAGMVAYHFVVVGLLKKEVAAEQKRNGELVIENAALHSANQKAADAIKVQNAAVANITAASLEMSKNAAAAMALVVKERDAWKGKYDKILAQPPPTQDDCQNTAIILEQYREARVVEMTGGTP